MNKQSILRYFMRGDCETVKDVFPDCKMLHQQMKKSMKGKCTCKHNSIRRKYRNLAEKKIDEDSP